MPTYNTIILFSHVIEISVLQYYSAVSAETRIDCQNILKIKYFKT